MKVLLLYPEFPDTFWSFRHALPFIGKRSAYPPLGLLTVSALLPPHWKRKLVDLNVEKLRDKDLAWADVAFLSAMLVQGPSLAQVIARCRKAGLRTVVGGPVTSADNPSYEGADHIVRGEAEEIIETLASDLETGMACLRYEAAGRADMTRVPPPDLHLARWRRYSAMPIQYSRGCPFSCEFCDVIELFGRIPRTKTEHQILAELEQLYGMGWRGSVFVVDDNFVGNKPAIKALLPRLEEWMRVHGDPFSLFTQASINLAEDDELLSLMQAARFNKVFIGIETPSVECNRAAGKMQNVKADLLACVRRIQEHGMEVMAGFIVGFDQDPPEIFEKQIAFIREAAIPISMVGVLIALPNTQLWRRLSGGRPDPAAEHGRQYGGLAEFHPQDGPGCAPGGLPESTRRHLQPVRVFRTSPGDDRPPGEAAENAPGLLGLPRADPVVRPAGDLRPVPGDLLALPREDVFPHAPAHRTGGDAGHHGAPLLYPDPPAGIRVSPSGCDIVNRTIIKPILFFLLSVAVLSLGGGCATLPKVSDTIDNAATQEPPQILSAKGMLSPEKSKAVMERLKRSVAPTDMVERYSAVIESVSGSPLTSGNKVTLLIDGTETYAAMFKAMENARDHINMETYIMEDDETGRRFSDLLLKKQAEGVQVNLIYDSRGSFSTPAPFFQRLRDAGIQVVAFNPINPLKARKAWRLAQSGSPQDSDHRRQNRIYGGRQHQCGVFEPAFRGKPRFRGESGQRGSDALA